MLYVASLEETSSLLADPPLLTQAETLKERCETAEASLREKEITIITLTHKLDAVNKRLLSVLESFRRPLRSPIDFLYFGLPLTDTNLYILCFREVTGGDDHATERSELLKLRVAVRMHDSEVEKIQARCTDLQAKLTGMEDAYRTSATKVVIHSLYRLSCLLCGRFV
jgi:hypothetical protein